VQARADALEAEQHHAEETGLQEEGGQHFVGEQRPGDAAGETRELAPVGAELVGHDDAADHAHAKGDGEHLQPEVVEVQVGLLPRLQPAGLEHRQIARQPDRQRREDDVEGNGEAELDPCQQQCIEIIGGLLPLAGVGILLR